MNADRAIKSEQPRFYYKVAPPLPGARRYIHLIDGGVADNIGLRGPLHAITSTDPTYSIMTKINN